MRVDVFYDTACPWCWIGKRHLQLALKDWTGEAVEVRYRAFFLNERLPFEGADFGSVMRAKGGSLPLEHFFAGPRLAGERIGLRFAFEQIRRAPNTTLSHRLIAVTPDERKASMLEAIYAAYFEHGQDIGQLETLVEIASGQGLDPEETRSQLQGAAGLAQVRMDVESARRLGIRGVPFFVFEQQAALSGAQPPEVIRQALEQVARSRLGETG